MFQVGDKVVYPMHGAGIIEAIEDREVLGERKRYYVLRLPVADMQVLVPCDGPQSTGLRAVMSEQVFQQVLEVLRSRPTQAEKNWNHRYRMNMEKIRSGDVLALAEVVRTLSQREREKGLSTGERKMLDSARQILLSEIVLIRGLELEQASSLLDRVLAQ
ncbi:CarD family transcriptional regulator [Symbiobacterium thermophilum]|uniref:Transcriptional regulator n=3 Tax=Symbiobacterium thermophilum TaxID=2734 RepID=Q67JP3_SYMTH|nr:CarD family transcriptional regulator [Symbiobacterium thermophilum]MBY6276546.1 CarD family transcriptional regulator [Symbiobacterium thermophilum]OTA41048.1 MAG: CarD family transcriptional regulator [Symbiobacterium thermophilum]BAD42107.1 transcriptional regulator [Symbiobacterium thermophilum IAM 14863]